MGKLEDHARQLLLRRHARMGRLIESRAPDFMLSNEARLIGEAGRMLCPESTIRAEVEAEVYDARIRLGLCLEPGCDVEVGQAGQDPPRRFCEAHSGFDLLAAGTRA